MYSSNHDDLATALIAGGLVMLLGLVACVLLVIHLLLTLTSTRSPSVGGFKKLAVAWWIVCALLAFTGMALVSVARHDAGLVGLILLAGLTFPAAMGWLAARTGKRLENAPEASAQEQQQAARRVNLMVLGVILTSIIGATLVYWSIYSSRSRDARQAQEKALQKLDRGR